MMRNGRSVIRFGFPYSKLLEEIFKIGRVSAFVFVLSALGAALAGAGTTGQLSGIIFNDEGVPLQGANVTTSSPAQIGAEQLATTGPNGRFRFPHLAPGFYTILVELVGYSPSQMEQVQVRLDRTTSVNVTLPPTSFSAEVEVVELTPVVDPAQVSTGQTFTSEYMTKTSTNWSNLITQTAGASNDSFRRVLGSTPQDGGYLLDGMDSTNWYQRYPNLAADNLPFDAVQEVAVHTAGFEAEFGQATGAVVNVSTKSGGNRFSGTVDARYTGSNFETAGEHYDPNDQESKNARFTGTLGGPILKDRLWFFTTYGRNDFKDTPTGSPTTYSETGDIFLGKVSWQPGTSWSVVGKYSYSPVTQDNLGSSQFMAAETTAIWKLKPSIATIETFGVLSSSVLWGLRMGRKEWNETGLPSNGDLESIWHYNLVTGQSTGSWGEQWYADSSQNEVSTDMTWFVDAAGSHELKAGLSYGNPRFTDDSCYNGPGGRCTAGVEGFYFRDLEDENGNSIPYLMPVAKAEGPLNYGGNFYVAFLQDAWRVRQNITLKLGIRWDRVEYDNDTGLIADLSKFQPRAGFAWDITNDGRTLLRASWGRFMHPGTAILASLTNETAYPTEYWLSCSTLVSTDPGECAAFADAQEFGYRIDSEDWDPAGWFLDPGNVFLSEPSQAVDGLRAGYADEWVIGFERELTRRTSIELSYVNKISKDGFDDTCNGNVPELTPDSECDYFVVANLPAVKWDYEGLMLRFETRAWDNLHLLASWVISESKGSMDGNTGATGAFDFYPYHFVNRYGHLLDHSRHRVKLNGYWLLPYGFSLAFNGWWDSEFRWTPYDQTVPGMPSGVQFVEPRGSGKGGDRHQIDLQASKAFRVGPARLVLLASVINLTNSQNENNICGSVTGCGEYDFGDGIEWQQPRRYELGFRVEF